MRQILSFGGVQRAVLAASLVAVLIGAVELVSIYRGSSLAVELAYFIIPAAVALGCYRSWHARLVAWVLLTVVSFLTVATLVIGFLTL